jgi:predicted nucleic acid-binding protein
LILLDTNVVSVMMSSRFDPAMEAFHASHSPTGMFLPSIVISEIRYGVQCLPAGKRRREIEQDFETFLRTGFAERIILFDAACAESYAIARAARRRAGRPVAVQDALIGGMALAYGATLATQNVTDFDGYGLSLINPWTSGD